MPRRCGRAPWRRGAPRPYVVHIGLTPHRWGGFSRENWEFETHRIEPAPERARRTPWKAFLQAHWDGLAACDLVTVEVLTLPGLTRYLVFFVIELKTRRVTIAGIHPQPYGAWMEQLARKLTDPVAGCLRTAAPLIHDRDPLYTRGFGEILTGGGVQPIRLPPKRPNLNASAERFVRSIKEECLNRVVPLGEAHLRQLVHEFVEQYHHERNHQDRDNQLLQRPPPPVNPDGDVERRERLGDFSAFTTERPHEGPVNYLHLTGSSPWLVTGRIGTTSEEPPLLKFQQLLGHPPGAWLRRRAQAPDAPLVARLPKGGASIRLVNGSGMMCASACGFEGTGPSRRTRFEYRGSGRFEDACTVGSHNTGRSLSGTGSCLQPTVREGIRLQYSQLGHRVVDVSRGEGDGHGSFQSRVGRALDSCLLLLSVPGRVRCRATHLLGRAGREAPLATLPGGCFPAADIECARPGVLLPTFR